MTKKKTFLFPGQGAQYPGMGKDFFAAYPIAKMTFEEADDILGRKLSDVILNGPNNVLTETRNSQTGIYVVSIAILRVVQDLFPELKPHICAGLSLGEYTAATAAGYFSFGQGLPLVQYRGQYMNDACEETEGAMAVVLGLDAETVENIVNDVNMPENLWVANFNCPGQVVISGTIKGVQAGASLAKERGAKRVLPLDVHGAFHSGLMQSAKEHLAEHIHGLTFQANTADLVMNVTGRLAQNETEMKQNLIDQVTSPVRWAQGIHQIEQMGTDLFIEMGPRRTLSGFNRRIGVRAPTISIEKVEDLKDLEENLTINA